MPDPFPIETTCDEVQALLDGAPGSFLFLDCREQNEYDLVKIDGAQLLPMSQIVERVGEISDRKGDRVVVHCHHGGRSLRVANWLRQQGFDKAQSMAGGIDDWAVRIDPNLRRY